jgi:hypothetical protein
VPASAIDRVLGTATRWRVDLTFDQLGHGTIVFRTDDPRRPGTIHTSPSHAFTLLPDHRIRLQPIGGGQSTTLSYDIRSGRLRFTASVETLAALSPADAAQLVAWISQPFAKV